MKAFYYILPGILLLRNRVSSVEMTRGLRGIASIKDKVATHSQEESLRVSHKRRTVSSKQCTVVAIEPLLLNPDAIEGDQVQFSCIMRPEDSNGTPNMFRRIKGSAQQMQQLKNMLWNGSISPSKSLLDIENPVLDESSSQLILETEQNMTTSIHHPLTSSRNLVTSHTGQKQILAVKVIDSGGLQHSHTLDIMANKIFGHPSEGMVADTSNLLQQMNGCSMGALTIFPANTTTMGINYSQTAPGMMEVIIDISLTNNTHEDIHNAIIDQVQTVLGIVLPGPFHHIMMIVENFYTSPSNGWAAYATVNGWMSVYRGNHYFQTGVQVHEIGHNFGLAHSGGLDGLTYTDHTGMMGNPLYSDDIGRMCFNPAKNWQLDWYENISYTSKKMIAPQDPNWVAENITLIGIANFSNNVFEHPIVVKIETGAGNDFFVGFNRASGINADNQEAYDEVTVIQVDSNNGESYSQSYLRATLIDGEAYTVTFGTTDLVISVISINIDFSPGSAVVEFKPLPPPPEPDCNSITVKDVCRNTPDCDWTGNPNSGNCFSTSGGGSDSCVRCGGQSFDCCTPNYCSGGKPSSRSCIFV